MQEKGFQNFELREWEWMKLYKTTNTVQQHVQEHFRFRRSHRTEQLLE